MAVTLTADIFELVGVKQLSLARLRKISLGGAPRLIGIFMNPDSLFIDGNIGGMGINPATAIEIVDSVLVPMHGGMGVTAEDARSLMASGIGKGAGRHF